MAALGLVVCGRCRVPSLGLGTWQLVINTEPRRDLLMVFRIQYSQNRESIALHLRSTSIRSIESADVRHHAEEVTRANCRQGRRNTTSWPKTRPRRWNTRWTRPKPFPAKTAGFRSMWSARARESSKHRRRSIRRPRLPLRNAGSGMPTLQKRTILTDGSANHRAGPPRPDIGRRRQAVASSPTMGLQDMGPA